MNRKNQKDFKASLLCVVGRLSLFLCLLSCSKSFAQAGTLDNTFGINGIVTLTVDTVQNVGMGLVLKPDGRIVMVGYSAGLTLVSLNNDGTKDSGFGNNGVVTNTSSSFGRSIVQQQDGKFVVCGSASQGLGNYHFGIYRFNSNGSIDPSYGINGSATLSISDGNDNAHKLALQPDGKIIIAGESIFSSTNQLVMARYDQTGNLDFSFGNNGIVTTTVTVTDPTYPACTALVLQPDGKILIGMLYKNNSFYFGVIRYNSNGSIDNSFGTNGMVTGTTISSPDIELQPDGKIILQGSGTGPQGYLMRLNSDGTYDLSFGTNGLSVPTPSLRPGQALYQPDGRILDCGWIGSAGIGTVVLTRYNSNGTIDNTFGINGITQTDIMPGIDMPHGMIMQPDGKILVCGEASDPNAGKSYFFVARYFSGLQIGLKENNKIANEFSISPNPFLFSFFLNFHSYSSRMYLYSITDLLGREIKHESFQTEFGKNTINISFKGAGGVYILRVFDEKKLIYTQKLIKDE